MPESDPLVWVSHYAAVSVREQCDLGTVRLFNPEDEFLDTINALIHSRKFDYLCIEAMTPIAAIQAELAWFMLHPECRLATINPNGPGLVAHPINKKSLLLAIERAKDEYKAKRG